MHYGSTRYQKTCTTDRRIYTQRWRQDGFRSSIPSNSSCAFSREPQVLCLSEKTIAICGAQKDSISVVSAHSETDRTFRVFTQGAGWSPYASFLRFQFLNGRRSPPEETLQLEPVMRPPGASQVMSSTSWVWEMLFSHSRTPSGACALRLLPAAWKHARSAAGRERDRERRRRCRALACTGWLGLGFLENLKYHRFDFDFRIPGGGEKITKPL